MDIGPATLPSLTEVGTINGTLAGAAQQVGSTTGFACRLAMLRSRKSNAVTIGWGGTSAVTASNAMTLEPGESTPWLPVDNVNRLFVNAASGVWECIYLR